MIDGNGGAGFAGSYNGRRLNRRGVTGIRFVDHLNHSIIIRTPHRLSAIKNVDVITEFKSDCAKKGQPYERSIQNIIGNFRST